jgi:cytochrome oxidase assembly protein ShyY1
VAVSCTLGALTALALARWQLSRDGERNAGRERAIQVEHLPVVDDLAGDISWRRVRLAGTYSGPVELEAGVATVDSAGLTVYGYEAWRRFDAPGGAVLVDLGWVNAEGLEASIAALPSPAPVEGQARPGRGGAEVEPRTSRGDSRIWPRGATAAMARAAGASLLVVQPTDGKLVPEYDTTSLHYALQWLGIAAAFVAAGGWTWWSRRAVPSPS